ncbi:DUF3892 domain-containing protein [Seleniivibrio woodruffii]|uniref:DUF3892 domain-containing protein n=1 Tax=Seleniivibrio woodruffii TaxID=1078050 RepID=UPI002409108B|nr:DUF3892 domain-containing protein [Seleniivibrio woodruffii]
MSKWADYCISAVRYDSESRYIAKLHVHPDNGDSIGSYSEWTRQDVLDKIDNSKTFVTITKNSDDEWSKGEDVRAIYVNGKHYLRTDANGKESDNLENLPKF